jgi:putative tricarboxylic transport membrane protein
LAPILEMSFRQSLSMSSGSYGIFINRPIAAAMLVIAVVLLLLNVFPLIMKKMDWRQKVGFAGAKE